MAFEYLRTFNNFQVIISVLKLRLKLDYGFISRLAVFVLGLFLLGYLSSRVMASGVPHDVVLRIGFLNEEGDASVEAYCEAFDVVLQQDATGTHSMTYVRDLITSVEEAE